MRNVLSVLSAKRARAAARTCRGRRGEQLGSFISTPCMFVQLVLAMQLYNLYWSRCGIYVFEHHGGYHSYFCFRGFRKPRQVGPTPNGNITEPKALLNDEPNNCYGPFSELD